MKILLLAFGLFFMVFPKFSQAYNAPKGIPDPANYGPAPFGWQIDRPTPAWPTSWTAAAPSPTPNYYYVDKTAANATDSGNSYGNPGKPRLTLPYTPNLAPGAFVYVHAGTYTVNDLGGRYDVGCSGTSAAPIWFSGNPASHPIMQVYTQIGGYGKAAYVIWENIDMSYAKINGADRCGSFDIRPALPGNSADHILIRNCTMSGKAEKGSSGGVSIGASTVDVENPFNVEYIVIYHCDIHTIGAPAVADSEECGIYKADRSRYVWALDNTIHGVGADGIAGAHGGNDTDKRSEYYFIGRNKLYQNGENGIDLKSTRYVVMSENEIYGPFAREQGWGIVIHSGSNPVPVRDCWIIFNRVHHCSAGIVSTSTNGARDCGIVGNIIYDIKNSYAVESDPWNGSCIRHGLSQGNNYIAENTCYDYEDGIMINGLQGGVFCKITGNVLQNRTKATGYDLEVPSGQESAVQPDYNFYPPSQRIYWNNGTRNFSYLKTVALKESHGLFGDVHFVDAVAGNFALKPDSSAIDAGVEGLVGVSAYAAFETLFGVAIRKDIVGTVRAQGGGWDMGALETIAGGSPPLDLPPPRGLRLKPR